MAEDAIFLLGPNKELVELSATPYKDEDMLQELIASYPNLLAGRQLDASSPRRWLLITREIAVPGDELSPGRWALDHLFVDQDAVPTLVEVKRSSDTRLRREVVGQLLDYAAHAVQYWRAEVLRERLEERCRDAGLDADAEVQTLIGEDGDVEAFWGMLKTRLKAEQIRLVILADAIPQEMVRVVEFLNGQMDPAEVIAIKLRQYTGAGHTTLVPRVLGKTAEAAARKAAAGPKVKWDAPRLLEAISDPADRRIAEDLLRWAEDRGWPLQWGSGAHEGTVMPVIAYPGGNAKPLAVLSTGRVRVDFSSGEARLGTAKAALHNRLNALPEIELPAKALSSWRDMRLSVLHRPDTLASFKRAIEAYRDDIQHVDEAADTN